MYDPASDPQAAKLARAVTQQLATVGIATTLLPLTGADYANGGVARKAANADLVWGTENVDHGDAVEALQGLLLPPDEKAALARIARLSSPERDAQAAALAARMDRQSLFAVYDDGAIPELVSRRLGCVVNQPEYAGVDLAALCLRPGVH